jgi:hypothetical protein
MAASKMSPAEFTRFSLLALTGSILLGLNIAGLLRQRSSISVNCRTRSAVPLRSIDIGGLIQPGLDKPDGRCNPGAADDEFVGWLKD